MVQVLVLVFLLLVVVLGAVLVSYLLSQRSVAQPRARAADTRGDWRTRRRARRSAQRRRGRPSTLHSTGSSRVLPEAVATSAASQSGDTCRAVMKEAEKKQEMRGLAGVGFRSLGEWGGGLDWCSGLVGPFLVSKRAKNSDAAGRRDHCSPHRVSKICAQGAVAC